MTGQPPLEVADIAAAAQEGRIGADTAVRWLELRLAEAHGSRHVRAHWDAATRSQIIDALDSALGGDQFSGLFPPSAPLGAEHEAEPGRGLVYPGESQGQRDRSPVSWDGYVHAERDYLPPRPFAAMLPTVEDLEDDDLHDYLFGPADEDAG
jgi:hypothetical protein